MGNIGPSRQRYDVLAVPAFGIDDADLWRLDTRPVPGAAPPPAEPGTPPLSRGDDEADSQPVTRTTRALR